MKTHLIACFFVLTCIATADTPAPAEPLALVNDSSGRVQTFLRPDVPSGWAPPVGYTAIPRDELPEGWQMEEAPAAPIPEVSRRQLFLWLASEGRTRAQIRTMLEAISDPSAREIALIEFDEAQSFRRDHPLIAQLAAALGYTPEQIDAGFLAAAAL